MKKEYLIQHKTIKEYLLELAQNGNKKFTESLHPGIPNILGLRIPDIRKLAKQIAKDDWKTYLESAESDYMEERMLQGFVIGYIPHLDIEERLQWIARFVPLINSWSVCDTFCPTLKFANKNLERVWDFMQTYLHSDKEYELRFGIIMLLGYYIDTKHLPLIFTHFNRIRHEGYYVKMAIAWALSVCYVKFPQETEAYLQKNRLDDFTQNKTIQKINESFRVKKEDKIRLKQYRRQ